MKKELFLFSFFCLIFYSCNTNVDKSKILVQKEKPQSANRNIKGIDEMDTLLSKNPTSTKNVKQDSIVTAFTAYVKNEDIVAISKMTKFPLKRPTPIPYVKNEDEFLENYFRMFDDSLQNMILNSDPQTDWEQVGWRGIMLYNGVIWLDTDGKLIAVNYKSAHQEKTKSGLISSEKEKLHSSVANFDEPVLLWETEKFLIRIDKVKGNYRYASWDVNQDFSKQPNLILYNGELTFDGSGGNHYYTFENKEYAYQCYIIHLGASDSPPGLLMVFKNDKEVLRDVVVKVLNQ